MFWLSINTAFIGITGPSFFNSGETAKLEPAKKPAK